MPDPTLHHNGQNCPACELRRDELRDRAALDQVVACNFCAGTGRVGHAVADIINEAVTWAKTHYWPLRETEYAKHNAAKEPK